MKVVYMSGYAEYAGLKGTALVADDQFVQKPVTLDEISSAIRRALDEAEPHGGSANAAA